MAANIRSAKILSGAALLGIGIVCLVFAYVFLAGPESNDSSPQPSLDAEPQAASQPPTRHHEPETGSETSSPIVATSPTDQGTEGTAAQPPSRLQETELEHLREVFQNSVAPSFQYDFRLDREGRAAIDAFVASMPDGLGNEDLDTLTTLIESQLSTPEAEDLAFIITHLYRLEEEEAHLMDDIGPVTTMAGQQEAQAKLAQLRDDWFGPELSARLFSDTDDGQSSATADSPDDNNAEETSEPQNEEQAELADIENEWEQRYQAFNAEKQFIDNAGLDQAEKDRQIEVLLQQHYAPEERDAARAFGQLDK